MSTAIPPFPTRPDEVPDGIGLATLVEAYNRHQVEVLVNRGRDDEPSTDAQFAHAVAALALLHALVDRQQAARWSTVRDALAADATRAEEVASACALEGSDVAAGLRSWADGQIRNGLITAVEHGAVELLARAVRGER